jgi:hypothetical protein
MSPLLKISPISCIVCCLLIQGILCKKSMEMTEPDRL